MISSKKIYCIVTGLTPEQAKFHCLSHIAADYSFRLEFTIDEQLGGLKLQIRGLTKEAGAANSDAKFNTNNVATLHLATIKVETLPAHPTLSAYNYPFGIIVFTHTDLNSEHYAMLVNSVMPTILNKFLVLFQHTPDTLNLLVGDSQSITGNTTQYQPPYRTNFAPATTMQSIPGPSGYKPQQQPVHAQQQQYPSVPEVQQQAPQAPGAPPQIANQTGLSYNQATGNLYSIHISTLHTPKLYTLFNCTYVFTNTNLK